MDTTSPNFSVFKEPKAFIKILQIVLTIIAFSLTGGFSTKGTFKYKCSNISDWQEQSINCSYPFKIFKQNPNRMICNDKLPETAYYGDFSGGAQFFVFVGVIVMLYCLAALVLYVCFSEALYSNDKIPKIDFVITAAIVALWFICSVVWADGVSQVKQYTRLEIIIQDSNIIKTFNISSTILVSFGGLNASLIAGFANIALWAANLWFLYKDTLWYEARNPGDQIIGNESVDGGNM